MLKFNVTNQIINRTDNFVPVADSKNYLKASFEFSEEWQGDIFAVFEFDGNVFHQLIKNGECFVPWEVIRTPGFDVSVFCGDLITSNVVTISLEKSGFKEGEEPSLPTPDVFKQYIDKLVNTNNEMIDGVEERLENELKVYLNNLFEALPDGDEVSY